MHVIQEFQQDYYMETEADLLLRCSNNINPDDEHFPITSLVSIENTCNKGGGSVWNFESKKKLQMFVKNGN